MMDKGCALALAIFIEFVLVIVVGVMVFSRALNGNVNEFDNYGAGYLVEDHSFDSEKSDSVCYYPNCTAKAEIGLTTSNPVLEANSKKLFKKLLKIKSKAGIVADMGTYTTSEEKTYYDKGTYLVEQPDGSYKIEDRVDKYTYSVEGDTLREVYFKGEYCETHKNEAVAIWKAEVKNALHTTNLWYWIDKYGIYLWMLLVISTAITAIPIIKGKF